MPILAPSWVFWERPPLRSRNVEVIDIPVFNARGMRPLYGRGDHYPRETLDGHYCIEKSFHLDLWAARDGRLLARFWSRSAWVDNRSLEIRGFRPRLPIPRRRGKELDERWVPAALRREYDDWIDEEID